ncbi:MAG: trypsin-like peptidase domain-containing protein, partial [Candidatus Saccharimonadales bacterium]
RPTLAPDHPKMKFLAMATLIIVAIASGFLGGWVADKNNTNVASPEKQQVVLKSQSQLLRTIAQNVGESVVSVNTTATVTQQDSFFGTTRSGIQEGAGTGIILTDQGLIITNRHVVPQGTTKVSVTLADGTEFEDVSVVGRTSQSDSLDIAFLKVSDLKGKKLKPATIGDSSKTQVGDTVIAIGNALGQFQNTVTSGILSGYGRSVQASDSSGASVENLEDLFQTDAAINQGNSGGPLVNLDGQVIGINTAVAGDGQNIGFAIPINDVSGLIDSVKGSGKLERPYIGVVYVPLTNDLAQQYNLSVNRGAYIAPAAVSGTTNPIVPDSPADKAGLKPGDIITKLDDKAVDQNNSLSALVNKHKVGDKVTLTILRDGKETKIGVTLAAAPTSQE